MHSCMEFTVRIIEIDSFNPFKNAKYLDFHTYNDMCFMRSKKLIVLHNVYIPYLHYQFTCFETFNLFPFFRYYAQNSNECDGTSICGKEC